MKRALNSIYVLIWGQAVSSGEMMSRRWVRDFFLYVDDYRSRLEIRFVILNDRDELFDHRLAEIKKAMKEMGFKPWSEGSYFVYEHEKIPRTEELAVSWLLEIAEACGLDSPDGLIVRRELAVKTMRKGKVIWIGEGDALLQKVKRTRKSTRR